MLTFTRTLHYTLPDSSTVWWILLLRSDQYRHTKNVVLCPELIMLPRLLFLLEIVYFKINNYEPSDKMQQFQLKFQQVSCYSSDLVFDTHYLTICVKYHINVSTHSMTHMQYGCKVRIKETGYIWMEFWMVLILQRKGSIGT